jgi:phosphoenolpyruvate carboxykinase (ATP)
MAAPPPDGEDLRFKADPKRHGMRSENVVAIDFVRKIVLIGGSYYAGEMKKSVFTTLNYYLPEKGVMPMHCSANVGPDGDTGWTGGKYGTGRRMPIKVTRALLSAALPGV